jgi:hypothetical protein
MKALLITKCQCSKMFDLIEFTNKIEVFLNKEQTIKRTFKFFDKQVICDIELNIYKEV